MSNENRNLREHQTDLKLALKRREEEEEEEEEEEDDDCNEEQYICVITIYISLVFLVVDCYCGHLLLLLLLLLRLLRLLLSVLKPATTHRY